MKKIVLIIIGILVLGIAVFVFGHEQPIFDSFYSEQAREVRQYKRDYKYYSSLIPRTIGNYELHSRGDVYLTVEKQCPDELDPERKLCGKFVIGEYRQKNTTNVVVVTAVDLQGEAKEKYLNYIKPFIRKIMLNGKEVFRESRTQLAWLPQYTFTVISAREAKVEIVNEVEQNRFETATGDNPVTKYFLNAFSPK